MTPNRLWHYLNRFLQNRVPGQLVIQMTDRCNALCPQCGMNTTQPFDRHRLGLKYLQGMIENAGARRIGAVSLSNDGRDSNARGRMTLGARQELGIDSGSPWVTAMRRSLDRRQTHLPPLLLSVR